MRRLNVVQLAGAPPFPPDEGAKIRSLHLLRALRDVADVTLVCFARGAAEERATHALAELGFRVIAVPEPSFDPCAWDHVRRMEPLLAQRYASADLAAAAGLGEGCTPADLVMVDGPAALMAAGAIERSRMSAVYHAHNVESEVYRRCLRVQRRPLRSRLAARLDCLKTRRFERNRIRRFSTIVAVSNRDATIFRRWAPTASVHVIPNGADCSEFTPDDAVPERGAIVFTGLLSYPPNRDAVCYFGTEIFPRIRRAIPWATWYVVGREAEDVSRILRGRPGIVLTGYADDVRPWVARAQAIVVPLRAGGGTRLKILEAMAMARPVVSTAVGAEGLDVTSGEHLLIADGADAFAAAVVRLLRQRDVAAELAKRARRLVLERHDWRAIGARYAEMVVEMGHEVRASPGAA
jgi:glycosyltransferase involved in cell wall biosynthesis